MECKTCKNKTEVLHSHHIVPLALGGLDEDCNIIDICPNCHGKIHNIDFLDRQILQRKGIERARKEGKFKGRVKGTIEPPEKFLEKHPKVIGFLGSYSLREIARKCNVSLGTVQKVKRYIESKV